MPFLKALMPCATSPMRSEILPRPNNSRTTAITTIQCQMLSEPILQPSKHAALTGPISPERRLGRCQKQGLGLRQIRVTRLTLNSWRLVDRRSEPDADLALATAVGLRRRSQRKFQISDLEG